MGICEFVSRNESNDEPSILEPAPKVGDHPALLGVRPTG